MTDEDMIVVMTKDVKGWRFSGGPMAMTMNNGEGWWLD